MLYYQLHPGLGDAATIMAAITAQENAPASWNNPGGLISNSWTQSLPGYVGQTSNGLAIFDPRADGQAAMLANIQHYASGGYTLQGMFNAWAPAGASNDPSGLNNPTVYAQNVASALGLSPSDTVSAALAGSGDSSFGIDFSGLTLDL